MDLWSAGVTGGPTAIKSVINDLVEYPLPYPELTTVADGEEENEQRRRRSPLLSQRL